MARFVLALAIGLVATTHTGIAQPSDASPKPSLELELGTDPEWVKPDLLLVSFTLRNTGTKPLVIAQRPGASFSMFCLTEDGGFILGDLGSVACTGGAFLELGPGEALLGKDVVNVPEECTKDITVEGEFETERAEPWDLPAHFAIIQSKPLVIDKR
jgi:hypothetical protein